MIRRAPPKGHALARRPLFATAALSVLLAATAAGQSMRITEVMANPNLAQGGQRAGEFVELFNLSEEPVDLTGWRIADRETSDAILAWDDGDAPVVLGLGFAVIFDPDVGDGYEPVDAAVVWLRPANASIGNGLGMRDALQLLDSDGVVVDTYTSPRAAISGVSYERRDFAVADIESNWRLTRNRLGTTLGQLSTPDDETPEETTDTVLSKVVLISELLYHPKTDAPEWVEIRSMSTAPGMLVGATLADSLGQPVVIPTVHMAAEGYAVLTGNAADFRHAHTALPPDIVVVEMSLPSLNDEGDTLTLTAANGVALDEMTYGALRPDDGRSLERRDADTDSGRMDNWLLCVDESGSTPGQANSVIYDTGPEPMIQVSRESFAPDSGQVEFRYDAPLEARVSLMVLSAQGALARTLLDDAPNGGRHTIAWDGMDDEGEPAAPGIYVAHLLAVTDGSPQVASAAVIVVEE